MVPGRDTFSKFALLKLGTIACNIERRIQNSSQLKVNVITPRVGRSIMLTTDSLEFHSLVFTARHRLCQNVHGLLHYMFALAISLCALAP